MKWPVFWFTLSAVLPAEGHSQIRRLYPKSSRLPLLRPSQGLQAPTLTCPAARAVNPGENLGALLSSVLSCRARPPPPPPGAEVPFQTLHLTTSLTSENISHIPPFSGCPCPQSTSFPVSQAPMFRPLRVGLFKCVQPERWHSQPPGGCGPGSALLTSSLLLPSALGALIAGFYLQSWRKISPSAQGMESSFQLAA